MKSRCCCCPRKLKALDCALVEAMACATPVVASDIPVLREIGADAAVYCAVADVPAWSTALAAMLTERAANPERWAARLRIDRNPGGAGGAGTIRGPLCVTNREIALHGIAI